MNGAADKFWEEIAPELRRYLGLHERSLEEAQKIFDAAEDVPLSKAKMEKIMRSISEEQPTKETRSSLERLLDKFDVGTLGQTPVPALNRNAGDEDAVVSERMAALRKKTLEKLNDAKEQELDSAPGEEDERETGGESG